jgi:hypothetical protein
MGKPSPDRRARCCCNLFAYILFGGILFTSFQPDLRAQSSQPPQASQAGTSPAAQGPGSKSQNEEITSHDSPATFKVRVNLVFVRVVVRDSIGKAIPNLKKEDFQLADNRKLQVISTFAREEIQQAVFSQEELQDVPRDCQTQFFKVGNGIRLSVVAHITTKGLKFTRAGDRSKDNLTIATAIFDENGNLVTGVEKIVEMKLTKGGQIACREAIGLKKN